MEHTIQIYETLSGKPKRLMRVDPFSQAGSNFRMRRILALPSCNSERIVLADGEVNVSLRFKGA